MALPLVRLTDSGLYSEVGNFHIDPWKPVERALITHAHADHARTGSGSYLAAKPGEMLLRTRLGQEIDLQTLSYGEEVTENGVRISFHPAGHVLGSGRFAWNMTARFGSSRATINVKVMRLVKHSFRFVVIPSSQNRRSACQSIVGNLKGRFSIKSTHGGTTIESKAEEV